MVLGPASEQDLGYVFGVTARRRRGTAAEICFYGHFKETNELVPPVEYYSVQYLDLLPRYVVLADGHRLRKEVPTVFRVRADDKQYWHAEHRILDIAITAESYDELSSAAEDMVAVMWTEYAEETDDNLTDKARALKDALKACFSKVG